MYYHGTNLEGLEELRPSKSNQGEWIYLSDLRERVLLYCANPIQIYADRKYGKGKVKVGTRMAYFKINDDGKLSFREIYPNFFKDMYGGQVGYIYTFENVENLQNLGIEHVFGSAQPIKTQNVEVIDDLYQEFLKLDKEGKIVLEKYDNYTEEEKQKLNERYLDYYKKSQNQYSKEFWFDHFPYIRENIQMDKK